jgi:hypothetical protein
MVNLVPKTFILSLILKYINEQVKIQIVIIITIIINIIIIMNIPFFTTIILQWPKNIYNCNEESISCYVKEYNYAFRLLTKQLSY